MRSTLIRALVPLALVFLVSGVTGCGDDAPQTGHVTLSAMAKPGGTASAGAGGFQDIIVGSGSDSLRISQVQFVLGQIELSPSDSCSDGEEDEDHEGHGEGEAGNEGDSEDNDGCNELEVNPLLVDLPLDAAPPVKILDAAVPAGTYTRLQAELRAVESGDEKTADFLVAHPEWAGLSVRVDGVYTGSDGVPHAFTFTSDIEAQIEMAFSSPLTVDASTQHLTLVVDVASWFVGNTGAVLDPRRSANERAINANIRSSFETFGDDDEGGEDNHEEHDAP